MCLAATHDSLPPAVVSLTPARSAYSLRPAGPVTTNALSQAVSTAQSFTASPASSGRGSSFQAPQYYAAIFMTTASEYVSLAEQNQVANIIKEDSRWMSKRASC